MPSFDCRLQLLIQPILLFVVQADRNGTMCRFGFGICVFKCECSPFFFSFLAVVIDFQRQNSLFMNNIYTVHILCMYCACILKILNMDLIALFTHLKIILLQCFQFSILETILALFFFF